MTPFFSGAPVLVKGYLVCDVFLGMTKWSRMTDQLTGDTFCVGTKCRLTDSIILLGEDRNSKPF